MNANQFNRSDLNKFLEEQHRQAIALRKLAEQQLKIAEEQARIIKAYSRRMEKGGYKQPGNNRLSGGNLDFYKLPSINLN